MRVLLQISAVMLIAAVSTAAGASQWGRVIGVPELDAVIDAATASAPARAAQRAAVRTAEGGERLARSARRPSVMLDAEFRGGQEQTRMTGDSVDALHPLRLGARVEWNLDPFQRIGAEVGAARFERDAAEHAERDWLLGYEALIVARYVRILGASETVRVHEALHASVAEHLRYLDARIASGLVLERTRHALAAALAEADTALTRARESEALALSDWTYLVGTNAPAPHALGRRLDDLRMAPAASSAELPVRALARPDIAAAYALWQQRDRSAAVASRNRLPELSAVASGQWTGPSTDEDPDEWMAWAGLRVGLPVVAPSRRARTVQSGAQSDQAEAVYQDVVRMALREVRDAHVSRTHADARLASVSRSRAARDAALASAERRRAAGLTAVDEVESLRRDALQAQLAEVAEAVRRAQSAVQLVRSLGGVD